MKEFDLYNIHIPDLGSDEQTELISYVLSKNIIDIYQFMFCHLDKATMSDEKDVTEKIYKFLRSKRFCVYATKIKIWCDIDRDNKELKFNNLSKTNFLEMEIASTRLSIAEGCTYDVEYLKELENEYYIKKQRKLKLQKIYAQ